MEQWDYWEKLRELPFPIVWSEEVDLRNGVLQLLIRSISAREFKVHVFIHDLPYLEGNDVLKIVPDERCLVRLPEGTSPVLTVRLVQLFLAHVGGDCYFMRQAQPKNARPRGKSEMISPGIMDEARKAHEDGSFKRKLPEFLEQLGQAYCTSDNLRLKWELTVKDQWGFVLTNLGRKLRPVRSKLTEENRYPYQRALEAKVLEDLDAGSRTLLWVACPTPNA